MGRPTDPSPVLVVMAAFSRYPSALAWARQKAEALWGPVALQSPFFLFDQTDYYAATMGRGLQKTFFAFQRLADPADLVNWKIATNAWETEYAAAAGHAEPRPLNLDPGYLTLGKLVLASTKDFAHRIYLSRGIYAEVTLSYQNRNWQSHAWTFADYRRAEYQDFLSRCRDYLHHELRRRRSSCMEVSGSRGSGPADCEGAET